MTTRLILQHVRSRAVPLLHFSTWSKSDKQNTQPNRATNGIITLMINHLQLSPGEPVPENYQKFLHSTSLLQF